MQIKQIRTLAGANVHTNRPALLARIDLEDLAGKESREFEDFNENLLALIPELHTHTCGLGYEGGFVERLHGGTYFGHIAEHIAIELSHLANCDIAVNYGKTREIPDKPREYNILVEYKSERAMKFLLEVAVQIVEKILAKVNFDEIVKFKDESLETARNIVADYELGPSTKSIVDAATKRGIPHFRIGEGSLVQFGYGKNARKIQAAMTSNSSAIAVEISCDKELTKIVLRAAEIPVPRGVVVRTESEAVEALTEFDAPLVVKPLDGRQGKGVSLNLMNEAEILAAFHLAKEYANAIIIEEQFIGKNYRILVVGGKMVAASERIAPLIVGDGEKNIAELIEIENQNPLRGEGHEKSLTQIHIDAILLTNLEKQEKNLEFVPHKGETVILRDGCNLSTGGTAFDVTDEVHQSIKSLCERAARAICLDVCGVDLMVEDISKPMPKSHAGIIELNAAPGLRMHLQPSEGKPRDVGAAIIENLFPDNAESRIPIISITGTNGKTTVTRMISHILNATGKTVGTTTTQGIFIGGECITLGDTTGPHSAKVVLSDSSVEIAVLETARGGIVKRGLGYDWSDVSVITNIQPDHIGQDGIKDVNDILHIKSVVAERVRENGTLILNADDELLARLPDDEQVKKIKRKIVYFSLKPNQVVIKRHISRGGTAYTIRNHNLVEINGEGETKIIAVDEIPVTLGGFAEFNVANALAAIAACRAQNVDVETIATALSSFEGERDNNGRANLFEVNGGYVFLDYGHNPEALKSICKMASQLDGERRIVGIIAAPGDR
ncbi:MAG: cyanophycin synthetase, partial [Pyrinomonadaceae bacterium]|nr:cyanophycin synthetase [Pyrinomonadaceae bacterium]